MNNSIAGRLASVRRTRAQSNGGGRSARSRAPLALVSLLILLGGLFGSVQASAQTTDLVSVTADADDLSSFGQVIGDRLTLRFSGPLDEGQVLDGVIVEFDVTGAQELQCQWVNVGCSVSGSEMVVEATDTFNSPRNFNGGAVDGVVGLLDDSGSAVAVPQPVLIDPSWVEQYSGGSLDLSWQFFEFTGAPSLGSPDSAGLDSGYLRVTDADAVYAGGYVPRVFGDARVASVVNADETNTGVNPDNQIDQGVISHFDPTDGVLEGYVAYIRYELRYHELVLAKFDADDLDPPLIEKRVRLADFPEGDAAMMGKSYGVMLEAVSDDGGASRRLVASAFDPDTNAYVARVEALDTNPYSSNYTGVAAITNSGGVNGTFGASGADASFLTLDIDGQQVLEPQQNYFYDVRLQNVGSRATTDNVEIEFTISRPDAVASGLTLEYCGDQEDTGTAPPDAASCQTWKPLPLTQDGDDLVGRFGPASGFPVGADYDATTFLRANYAEAGNFITEARVVSVDSGVTEARTIQKASVAELSFELEDGVDGLVPAGDIDEPGWSYYTGTLTNEGDALPENVALWVEVAGLDNDDFLAGDTVQFYAPTFDGSGNVTGFEWRDMGWGGAGSWQLGRDAWFIGRSATEVTGFEVPTGYSEAVPLRVNFANDTYDLDISVETADQDASPAWVYGQFEEQIVAETDPVELDLEISEGVNPAIEQPGFAHFTATLTNTGGDVPENVLLWTEVDGITNGNVLDFTFQYFDGNTNTWVDYGWGGFGSGDFPEMDREAYFIGRNGSMLVGLPIPAGYSESIPLRMDFDNGTYQVTTSVESFVDGAANNPGDRVYLSQTDELIVESDPVDLSLDISEGVNPAIEQPGFAHFTATLSNTGGDVPENVLLWTEVSGITNGNVLDFTFQYFDGNTNTWVDYGWGGFGSGDFPEMDREAYFIGRNGSMLVGLPIPAGYSESIPLRMDFDNGTYQVTTSVESFVDGAANNPGDRVYLNQSDSLVVESDPVDLSIDTVEGLDAGSSATQESGWTYYTSTLTNNGGATPENIVLWVEVVGPDGLIDDANVVNDNYDLQLWDGSQWQSFGWAGGSTWTEIRQAWFLGRSATEITGFPIPANSSDTLEIRANFPNGSYDFTTTVESLDSAEPGTTEGERVYLDVQDTRVIENVDVELSLGISEGVNPAIEQPGFAHFTATLTNTGGDVPENVLLWTEVSGITNGNVQDFTFQYFDGNTNTWVDYGWGGFGSGDFPDMDREAYFIGRNGSMLVGIEIPAGYSESIPLRMDFDNGTYQVTTSVESFVDGAANNPGDRVYLSQTDSLVIESDPAALSLDISEGVNPAIEQPGFAHFTATLSNTGGDVPENVLLWTEVDGITNGNVQDFTFQYFDGNNWVDYGWGGFGSGDFEDMDRQAYFIGRDGSTLVGIPILAGDSQSIPLRMDFENGTYEVTTSVESFVDGDANNPGDRVYLSQTDSLVIESEAVALDLDISEGVNPAIEQPGFAHFTATLSNTGGDVPENVLLWTQVDGITNANVQDFTFQYFDGNTWVDCGWGGYGSGDFAEMDRQAYFIGRDGATLIGLPIPAGYSESIPLRMDFDNGTYQITTSVESFVDGEANNPGDRVYLSQTDELIVESDPVDLSIDTVEGLDAGSSATQDSGWAYYTSTLTNDGGATPENIVLWVQVEGPDGVIDDDNVAIDGFDLQLWDDASSSWQSFGWAGGSTWTEIRQSWFLGRGPTEIVGFPIPASYSDTLEVRANFPNGSYDFTTTVESLDSAEPGTTEGERIYLDVQDTRVVENVDVELSLDISEGVNPAIEQPGFAHFTATLSNTGGDVPENVLLWTEVDGITNTNVQDFTFQYFDGSNWVDYGWGGFGQGDFAEMDREAYFIGRNGSTLVGIEIPAGYSESIPLRMDYDNGTYQVTTSVESFVDGAANNPGERVYLSQSDTLEVEQYIAPQLNIAPASHDFGQVAELDTAVQTFALSNDGSSTTELTLGSIEATGSNAGAYQVSGGSCSESDVLAGGDACDVEVTFVPGMPGSFGDAQLSVASDANAVTADLSGIGIEPDWADDFDGAFDEDGWQFFAFDGSPTLYQPATAQISGDYLQINDPAALYAGGYLPRSFGESRVASLVNADGTNTGTSPDNQIDQGVVSHFDPDLLEGYSAYIRYELDAQELVLAKFDAANLDPALIDQRIELAASDDGDWSKDRMYVVELEVVEQGGDALLIARAFDADTGALLGTVEAVDTAPFGPGYAGVAVITNSTGINGTFDTASAASSFASADASDDLVGFGPVEAFTDSGPQTVTIDNRGNIALEITGLSVGGSNAAQFAINNSNCDDPVAAGASCSFELVFTPDGVGAASAEVVIQSNASTSPHVVLLEGEGTPGQATVTLSDLTQVYDGDPKSATVTTDPAGLNVIVTYDGGSVLPVVAGSYSVQATIDEVDYVGADSATLTIEQSDQEITFPAIGDKPVDAAAFTISASAESGLPVSFSLVSGPAMLNGNEVTLTGGLGEVVITADQGGNANWNAAPSVQQSFQVVEGDASSIAAASPTTINGQAGEPVAAGDLPTVQVTDSQGNAVAGATVNFSVASGGGSITGATQTTDAMGMAQVGGWTLGGAAVQILEATAPGLTGSPVVFTANADADYEFTLSVDDSRETIEVGERNSYVIVISNEGSSDAIGAQVTAQLPSELDAATADWTCVPGGAASCGGPGTGDLNDAADLPAGASVFYVLEAEVIGGSGGSIELQAEVSLGGATASGSDSTNVAISEDGIFSDRFEAPQASNAVRFDSAREQASVWLQFANRLTGGLPPRVILRGENAAGDNVLRVRAIRAGQQLLVRLSVRDSNGNWQRAAWQPVTSTERLLAVDYNAATGTLLVTGEQFQASLIGNASSAPIKRLVTDDDITLQQDD